MGAEMPSIRASLILLVVLNAIAGWAGEKALVTSMKKVKCGAPVAKFSVIEALVGPDTITPDLSCLEFTLRTPKIQYRLRPSRQMLVPVGSTVQVRFDKKHVLVQIEDAKAVRCEVVSMDLLDEDGQPVEPREIEAIAMPPIGQAFIPHSSPRVMPHSSTRNCLTIEGEVVPCGN